MEEQEAALTRSSGGGERPKGAGKETGRCGTVEVGEIGVDEGGQESADIGCKDRGKGRWWSRKRVQGSQSREAEDGAGIRRPKEVDEEMTRRQPGVE